LLHYLNKALTLPPNVTIKKAIAKAVTAIRNCLEKKGDLEKCTYCLELPFKELKLQRNINALTADVSSFPGDMGKAIARHFVEHRFDLLGSGWTPVYHGMKCRGLEGYRFEMGGSVQVDPEGQWLEGRITPSNLIESQRIWQLIDSDYTPIDWHIDFKSGYRWSESTWYNDIKFGHKLGVDIKVPWELARMQHLPQLAIFQYALEEGTDECDNVQREFRNQVLDFIANNPPRFGVNWVTPMDVAIRATNWLIAYDIFRASNVHFDNDFEAVFRRSIYDHGQHIINNLEWKEDLHNNHYLADITGLAFISAYLPTTPQTDAWLAFSVEELIKEVKHQFYPDGGNFEGSTAYHRLSAEMVYFATALILGLTQQRIEKLKRYDHKLLKTEWGKPKLKPSPILLYRLPDGSRGTQLESPFPNWYFERMERMAEFIMDITKPNGNIPQIGDNDNGRFLKLGSNYVRMTVKEAKKTYCNLDGYSELPLEVEYYKENHLDCGHLIAAAYSLFDRDDFGHWLGGDKNTRWMGDFCCMSSLSNGTTIGTQRFNLRKNEDKNSSDIGTVDDFNKAISEVKKKPREQIRITEFPARKGDLLQDLTLQAYPDFGLYLETSPRLYLAIRCWSGQKAFCTGHMHNDQLAIELVIDGQELITDPGTYLYTPLRQRRNEYRSVKAHFTPWVDDKEPASFQEGDFVLKMPVKATAFIFKANCFLGLIQGGCMANRVVIIEKNIVRVIDYNKSFSDNCKNECLQSVFSEGYGWRTR